MRMCWLLVFAGLFTTSTTYAGLIKYSDTNIGTTVFGDTIYRYTFTVSGITLQANQELDIRFNPALFKTLSNPTGGSGFSVLVLQPNSPLGDTGVFSALALVNNPVLSPFTVDVTYASAFDPGSQPYLVNQYDANHMFVSTIQSGFTVPAATPEPSTFGLGGLMLAIGSVWRVKRRSRSENAT
jgi:hypothetical protein